MGDPMNLRLSGFINNPTFSLGELSAAALRPGSPERRCLHSWPLGRLLLGCLGRRRLHHRCLTVRMSIS